MLSPVAKSRVRGSIGAWSCALLLAVPAPQPSARPEEGPEWAPGEVFTLIYEGIQRSLADWSTSASTPRVAVTDLPPRFVVEDVVQISRYTIDGPKGSQDDTQVEPDIAVDPTDPSILVAVFQQGRFPDGASAAPGYATSHDGGATWTSDALPHLTVVTDGRFARASDPVVAIGPDGSVYAQTLAVDFEECRSAVAVQRSDDGGFTWNAPVLAQDDEGCRSRTGTGGGEGPEKSRIFNDKNWITVDVSRKSPHYGRIYSTWTRGTPKGRAIVARYSDDRGDTWSKPITVSGSRGGIGVIPLVQPNGDVTVVYMDFDRHLLSQTSHDGGETFKTPVAVSEASGGSPEDFRGFGLPSAAVDAVTGHMFVAWQDSRWRSDHLNDVALSKSTDGGRTWTEPRRVTQGEGIETLDHLTPDVAAHDGSVHLTYTTRRTRTEPSGFMKQRYRASLDRGITFEKAIVLGPRIDLRFAARDGERNDPKKFLGDYVGIAVSREAVHPAWVVSSEDGGDPGRLHQVAWSATIAPRELAPGPARAR